MSNRKFSRITSFFLALCMMFTFLPTAAFISEAEEPGDGMHFNFGAAGYEAEADLGYEVIRSYDDYYSSNNTRTPTAASKNTDPWYIDGESFTYEADEFFLTDGDGLRKDTDGDGTTDDVYEANALSFKAKGNDAVHPTSGTNKVLGNTTVAITLKADESGIFVPSLTCHVGPKIPKYDVYLVPKNWGQYTGYTLKKFVGFNGGATNYKNMTQQIVTNRLKKPSTYPEVTGFKLGTIDMYAKEDGIKTFTFDPYEIDENTDYILFLNVSNANTALYNAYGRGKLPDYVASIHSFDLTPAPAEELPVISSALLSLDSTSICQGRTAKASVDFFLDDGTKVDKAVEYTLESSDKSVATVDKNTGIVTAVAPGTANITVTLTSDSSVTDSVEITVTEEPYLKELIPSLNQITLYMKGGESSATLTAQAKMTDDVVQSAVAYNLTFESSNKSVATVTSENGTATVTAVASGSANIIISTTNEKGDPCSVAVPVYVKEVFGGMHFNFSAANRNKDATADIPAEDIKANGDASSPVYASIGTDPWYIDGQRLINDYRLTSASADTENYPNSKPDALYWRVYNYSYLNPVTSSGSASAALVLRVKISGTGVFTPTITYEAGPTSTRYAFFLAPVSTFTASKTGYKFYANSDGTGDLGDINITNKAPLQSVFKTQNANLIELGEQNLYAAESEKRTVSFLPVGIDEPGEYYLYMVANGRANSLPAGSTTAYYDVNLYSLELNPVGTVDGAPVISSAKLSLDKESIAIGRTTKTSVKFFQNDGTESAKAYKYTLESSDPDVATVDEKTGLVTAVSEGKVTITAKLAIDPKVSSSAELTVTEKPTLREIIPSSRSLTLYKAGGTSTETITLQAGMSDGITNSVESYDITFESSDANVVTVAGGENGTATVTAVAPGSAHIIISTTNEKDEPCSVTIPVLVKGIFDGIHFNFSAESFGKNADISEEAIDANDAAATPEFATVDTDPWRIDGQRVITDYRITSASPDTEKFPMSKPGALYWNIKGYEYLNPITSSGSASAALVLRVKINSAGTFTPSITYGVGPTSTRYAFFLAPVSAFTTSKTGYNCYANADGTGELGDVNITNKAPLQSVFKTQNSKLIKIGELNLYAAEESKKNCCLCSGRNSRAG